MTFEFAEKKPHVWKLMEYNAFRYYGEFFMGKYYVTCGNINMILDRETSRDAALDTCRCLACSEKCFGLSWIMKVSELGDTVHNEDTLFLMEELLVEAGVRDSFFSSP